MNKYDEVKKILLELIKELDDEQLARLLDELDYILQTRVNSK